MPTMDKCFIDSNVFIYSLDDSDVHKQKKALKLLKDNLKSYETFISTQVVKEVSNVSLKRLKYTVDDVNRIIDLLNYHKVVDTSVETIKKGLETYRHQQLSFYDSLLIATAIENNCKVFFSEDMNHGQTIEGLQIINPFQEN